MCVEVFNKLVNLLENEVSVFVEIEMLNIGKLIKEL